MATKKRSRYIRNADWDRYKHVVQKFLEDDSGRQTIGWCRHIDQMLFMGEDKIPKYTLILIEALCYYNAFRNWPINKATVSGELDDENLVILIPKSAIQQYLNKDGYFQFNWSEDTPEEFKKQRQIEKHKKIIFDDVDLSLHFDAID